MRALTVERGAWWRLALGVAGGIAGLLVLPVLAYVCVLVGARLLGFPNYTFNLSNGVNAGEMLSLNLGLALLIPLAAVLGRLQYCVRIRSLSSTEPGLLWRCLAT